jgi:hypothetical protein
MSDEPQRSLSGYKSKVHEQSDFENPNEGKPPLTEFDEYTLRLTAFPKVKTFQQLKKINGKETPINVDKAIIVFEEETTKNEVLSLMRVDSLNFSEDDAFESAIIRFFRKIGHPLVEGVEPNWDDYFVVGMRFLARVAVGKDDKKSPNGKYYLDVPTCRPLKANATAAPTNPTQYTPEALANALFIAKGAKTNGEAMDKLKSANAPKDIVMALFNAELDGKITYPI